MAHPAQRRFIELVNEHIVKQARPRRILEVGSYNVLGTIRDLFPDATSYIGADLMAGPGVDMVKSGHEIDLESNSLDLALSCECFEHNPYWFETFLNMIRMTRPGGLVVLTCASRGRLEHGTARSGAGMSLGTRSVGWQYYRNLRQSDFEKRADLADHFAIYRFYYIWGSADLYFFGIKKGGELPEFDLPALEREVARIRLVERGRDQPASVTKRVLWAAYQTPIVGASFLLDDKLFQTFALNYIDVRTKVMRKVRSVALRFLGWRI
jgi:SAM-dependent methyltransferase